MDGAERMLRITAGRDIECPLRGADAVPQHDNRNGEPICARPVRPWSMRSDWRC